MKAFVILVMLVPLATHAVKPTIPSPGDDRIHYVDYDPANVLEISTKYGRQTVIVFGEHERVIDMGGGDTKAWTVGVGKQQNSIFLKPKAQNPDSNLTVITTGPFEARRIYNIDLKLDNRKRPMYMVQYRYPKDVAQKDRAQEERAHVESLLKQANGSTSTEGKSQNLITNTNYWMQGAESIAPVAAWDDGYFTRLRFPPRAQIPVVYGIDEKGEEHLVNSHAEEDGNVIAIHQVYKKLVLRRGDIVTCIFNEAYDPVGTLRPTNTVAPNVERVLRGDK